MDLVGGFGFRPVPVMATGRGRGRGRGIVNSDENLGKGHDQGQVIGSAILSTPLAIGTHLVSEDKSTSSSSSSSSSSPPETSYLTSDDGTIWESIENQPEEVFRQLFGDSKMQKAKKMDSEDTNGGKQMKMEDEETKTHIPPGFLDPQNITLATLSDTIEPGDERYCAVYTMANTDTIYLIFSNYFSHTVDGYIRGMGRWYFDQVQGEMKLLDLNVRDEELVAGAIVVVYHKPLREWKRAKIVDCFDGRRGRMYKVLFLDLGDCADVPSLNIVYMHEGCKEKPLFAIRARLALSKFYNCGRYSYYDKWNKMVIRGILEAVHNKMVLVKFIEKVDYQNEKVWNVSLLSAKDRTEGEENSGDELRPESELSGYQPIEKQVIAKMMGRRYVD